MPYSTLSGIQSFKNTKLVILDLDGTLYDQSQLRFKMLSVLLWNALTFRLSKTDFAIIRCFRKERKNRLGYASDKLDEEQYEWCANKLHLPANKVKRCIEKWMYNYPLKYLNRTKYAGTDEFFSLLSTQGKKIVIYSDYPVDEKLTALGLHADKSFCSTNSDLNQLKPSKKSLDYICACINCTPQETLYIGDRADTDGEGAKQAGIPFILVDAVEARKGIFYNKLNELLTSTYDQ